MVNNQALEWEDDSIVCWMFNINIQIYDTGIYNSPRIWKLIFHYPEMFKDGV